MEKGNKTVNKLAVSASEFIKKKENMPATAGVGVFVVTGLLSGAVIVPALIGGAVTYFLNKEAK